TLQRDDGASVQPRRESRLRRVRRLLHRVDRRFIAARRGGSIGHAAPALLSCRAPQPAESRMKRIVLVLLVVLVGMAAGVVPRTLGLHSRQVAVAPVAPEPLDSTALAQRLAGALKFKTISYQDSTQFEAREFDGFQRYIRESFPKVHATLKLEKVNGYGLLYEWVGSDTGLAPAVLLAHQDVVPIEPGTEGKWPEPPFGGAIAAGYIWGRGALDDKGSLLAILE